MKEFSGISESGVHQLWLLVQHRKLKSLLVCIAYRPPDTPISFLNDDLMPAYTQALLLNKDIILTGDLNCDVLPENHNREGRALLSFFTDVNATQLIDKPTRVTATSRTLIDIITVSNPGLVRRSDVQELTISYHYLVYASLDLKVPKQSKISITTRSFKNYVAEEFAEDISRVPWDSLELLNSIDEKVEAFNDLFMACLDKRAPLKSFKVKNKPKTFITNKKKQSISTRNNLHKKAKFLRTPEAWCAFKSYRHQVKLEIRIA